MRERVTITKPTEYKTWEIALRKIKMKHFFVDSQSLTIARERGHLLKAPKSIILNL